VNPEPVNGYKQIMSIFKKFDHIGIVVADLQKATDALLFYFDLRYDEFLIMEEAGIQIAFYPLGAGQMEIIEFRKPMEEVDSIVLEPRPGVQHVAFQVENFDNTLQELIEKGLRVVRGFPREGAHGKVAFFYPTDGLDLMVEICEAVDNQAE
jgi:methylmalonyl-CoA/ethylmalonyl-CoA epimerase